MTSPTPQLTLESARRSIGERSFRGETPKHTRVGIELEWFTEPSARPHDVEVLERVLRDVALPCGSQVTFEPGAQVELSSRPYARLSEACDAVAADSDVVRATLAAAGVGTFAAGADPHRALDLRTSHPRYVAMRHYLDTYGPAGGRMMCGSAAIHVNLDAGDDDEGHARWHAAHVVGPMLVAAFANSPAIEGQVTGWKSSRFEAWKELDGTRTAPVEGGHDPVGAWTDYVLAARVMFIRREDRFVPLVDPLTFAQWIERGHELGHPTQDDLDYHQTTLFPPVRAHGWIELRMMDMLPDPWWRAAVAVATAIVTDPHARASAVGACHPTISMWESAARRGLDDPALAAAATRCFDASLAVLEGDDLADVVREYADRYIRRRRTPADDLIQRDPIDLRSSP